MALLSRRTIGLAVRKLQHLPWSRITLLLYEHEIPNNLPSGSKENYLLGLFQALQQQGKTDKLLRLLQSAMSDLPEDSRRELEEALIRDGYVSTGKELLPDEPHAVELRSGLEALIARNAQELDHQVLLHHLKDSEEFFRLEKWDSCIGQARKFVEQLLADIANVISAQRGDRVDLSKPVKVRDYFQACGFFDESERKKLVDGIYGYFSDEGAHPGISTQTTARFCLSVLWTFSFYVLEKFETWRNQGYRQT